MARANVRSARSVFSARDCSATVHATITLRMLVGTNTRNVPQDRYSRVELAFSSLCMAARWVRCASPCVRSTSNPHCPPTLIGQLVCHEIRHPPRTPPLHIRGRSGIFGLTHAPPKVPAPPRPVASIKETQRTSAKGGLCSRIARKARMGAEFALWLSTVVWAGDRLEETKLPRHPWTSSSPAASFTAGMIGPTLPCLWWTALARPARRSGSGCAWLSQRAGSLFRQGQVRLAHRPSWPSRRRLAAAPSFSNRSAGTARVEQRSITSSAIRHPIVRFRPRGSSGWSSSWCRGVSLLHPLPCAVFCCQGLLLDAISMMAGSHGDSEDKTDGRLVFRGRLMRAAVEAACREAYSAADGTTWICSCVCGAPLASRGQLPDPDSASLLQDPV